MGEIGRLWTFVHFSNIRRPINCLGCAYYVRRLRPLDLSSRVPRNKYELEIRKSGKKTEDLAEKRPKYQYRGKPNIVRFT